MKKRYQFRVLLKGGTFLFIKIKILLQGVYYGFTFRPKKKE